jgi:chromosome partitioning protein
VIITIGGIKGGAGKTTIATNFAVMRHLEGRDVLLVDGDDQGSSSDFSSVRSEIHGSTGYTSIKLSGTQIRTQGLMLSPKYDDIFIDVGGRDTTSQRAALIISDIALIPFIPRSFDIWTLGHLVKLIDECKTVNNKLKIITFLNRADASGSDNNEAAEALKEIETFKYIDASLGNRKVFGNAASNGQAVVEQKPIDKKAMEELKNLYENIFRIS